MKRDIAVKKFPDSVRAAGKSAVNKGLPTNNTSLSEVEILNLGLATDIRKGAVRMKVFDKG